MSSDVVRGDLRSRLESAWASLELLRMRRDVDGGDRLDGYVLGIGRDWLLTTDVDGAMRPNGFTAVRVSDVSRVTCRTNTDRFHRRALELQGAWPPPHPKVTIPLDDVRSLVERVAAAYSVLCLYVEENNESEMYIGEVADLGADFVWLRELNGQAEWELQPSRWMLDSLTRIDFGQGYETMLHSVAVEPPELS